MASLFGAAFHDGFEQGKLEARLAPSDIFLNELKGAPIDFEPIKSRWAALSDVRLREYEDAIPPEWAAARDDIDAALKLIADARDNIDACIAELGRILS
jgi:hypothetical protein